MYKEIITNRQGIFIVSLFIIGSFIIIGGGGEAKQDVWIAILLSFFMAIPIYYVYSQLLRQHPGKDLYDVAIETFGKIPGKIICLLSLWYSFHLGSLVIRNFSSFVNVVSFPETPPSLIITFIGLFCIWMVKEGIEVLGRWTAFAFPIAMAIIIITAVFSLTKANFINLKPVLYDGIKPLLPVSFGIFSFPFAETVVLTTTFNSLKNTKKAFNVFFTGTLIGCIFMISISVRNVMVLGVSLNSDLYFPSYMAVRTLNIGDFIQRFEIVVAIIFILGGFVKISICLLSAAKGLARVLNINNYRDIVSPVAFLMMAMANIIYSNIMEMFDWAQKIYPYYAVPFQIIIPVLVMVSAKIKTAFARRKRRG